MMIIGTAGQARKFVIGWLSDRDSEFLLKRGFEQVKEVMGLMGRR